MTNVENLTVQEALTAVLAPLTILPPEPVALPDALGRVLAAPIIAQDNLPPFANSSMDGYAFIAADLVSATDDHPATLQVIGDIAAGSAPTIHITRGTAVRIMTGAPIPPGADAVIPVEDTNENWRDKARPLPATIQINRPVKPGDYIRPPGGDIQAGQTVLQAGHIIRPQEIGLLAALGIAELLVVRRPLVGILATGDELIPITEPLQPGKIRNSNGYAQAAQVAALGAIPLSLGIARDSEADVRAKLQTGLDAGVDLFISSAGVSVGAYDVVKAVLEAEGNIGFWRVRMRPGKPLAYGSYKGVPYIGLPGNPVSAMVSFERFARAAILKMAGHTQLERLQVLAELQEEMESDGRESYIRAIVTKHSNGYIATPTGSQDSHMLTSLVRANALLIIPEGVRHVPAGHMLTAWMLDQP
ncbi:MAG: molybdopterin molybdotransferase MoeA [Chloroflexi bacterium]|nr:molybdopterin molybdotransferase MoeA [Ardenticatenaceae bacterium]NOG33355.1 molybdopterin molybdotransferase MoeA [Chloroflexota bacterium]